MNIKNEVISIICESTGMATINSEDDLLTQGILDSFAMMNVLMLIEEKFGIEISFGDITPQNFGKVDAIVAMVDKYI